MNYLETYEIWKKKQLEDPDLIAEMIEIEGNEQEIKERFIRMLEFGTAGLRGILGVGTNRMNIYTVALATQGMADYINEQYENPTVAIAYDSRIKSDLFARVTARVFAANGVKAYLFKDANSNPFVCSSSAQMQCWYRDYCQPQSISVQWLQGLRRGRLPAESGSRCKGAGICSKT